MHCNKFFHTRKEATAFQAEHGGEIYADTRQSKTKREFQMEMAYASHTRNEIVMVSKTPWCVAWDETEKSCLNCLHKSVCLIRGMALFQLYIQTGRYDEAASARDRLNICTDCASWEEVCHEQAQD